MQEKFGRGRKRKVREGKEVSKHISISKYTQKNKNEKRNEKRVLIWWEGEQIKSNSTSLLRQCPGYLFSFLSLQKHSISRFGKRITRKRVTNPGKERETMKGAVTDLMREECLALPSPKYILYP